MEPRGTEAKFGKSLRNRGTENTGLRVLLADARFQHVDLLTKRHILASLPVSGTFGIQTFDAVMTPEPAGPIHAATPQDELDALTLIEMKTTLKPIKDAALNGFFFGATEREYTMAAALRNRYRFAFVVLNDNNVYGAPFAVLLTLDEVEERTRARRIQYQVNFKTDMEAAEPGMYEVIRLAEDPGA